MDTSNKSAFTTLQLLRRVRRGDRLAIEELFERHLPRLHRWARGRLTRRARNRMDTADVVQEAAYRVFQRLGSFEPRHRGALQAYLRQAVANRLKDEQRRVLRDPDPASLPDDLIDAAQLSQLDRQLSDEVMATYRRALRALPLSDQQAVVARIELGYSYDQIALMIEKPSADAARMTVTRALVRVAKQMEVVRP